MATIINTEITSMDTKWWDADTKTSYSGDMVEKFIKKQLTSLSDAVAARIGWFYFTAADSAGKYHLLGFASEADCTKYLADTTANAALVLCDKIVPDTHRESGTVVVITNETTDGGGKVTTAITKKLGNKVAVKFAYDQINNQTDQSTGVAGAAVMKIVTASNVSHTITKTLKAGSYEIDVSDYVAYGTNQITLTVTAGTGETAQSATAAWAVELVTMELTTTYKHYADINQGDTIRVPFKLTCNGAAKVLCYVDGDTGSPLSIDMSDGGSNSFSIDTSAMSHGTHTVQMVAAMTADSATTIYSNSIMMGLAVKAADNDTAILTYRFDFEDGRVFKAGETVTMDVDQYSEYAINYACTKAAEVAITIGGETEGTTSVTAVTAMTYNGRALTYGTQEVTVSTDGASFTFTLNIIKSAVQITETTDGLKLKLSAQGRSNSDTDKAEWKYGGISCELKNFTFDADGWRGSYLRHKAADRTVVNWKPLDMENYSSHDSGFTAVIKYRAGSTTDDDAVLIDCTDDEGTGFKITATQIMFTAAGGTTRSMRLAPDAEYEVAFVSRAWDTDDNQCGMMYLYINGKMSGAVQRTSTESIYQTSPVNITMGSSEVMLDVYSLRIYEKALDESEVLGLYIYDQDTTDGMLSLYTENNVLSGGSIDLSKLPEGLRVVIITGEEEDGTATPIKAAQVNNKKTKYAVTDILSYVVGAADLTKNIHVSGGYITLQGTSSLGYPTKNYRVYTLNKDKSLPVMYVGCDSTGQGGTLSEDNLWSFRKADGTQKAGAPVSCFCIKADYAESSASNNTGLARLIGYALKQIDDQTPAQQHVDTSKYPYDVRTTVDGEPCVLFYRNTLSGTLHFLARGNFNNDKSTEAVFGYRDIPGYHDSDSMKAAFGEGVNPVQCWEFLNNTEPLCNFTVTDAHNFADNWTDAFESRFPDGGTDTTYLKKIVEWISGTKDDAATFKKDAAQYLDVNNILDYYVFTVIFAMVDQRAKNQMMHIYFYPELDYTTDAMKGLRGGMEFYDNDTARGLINNGMLKLLWDVDFATLDGDNYAFAGHDSILWQNVRAAYPDELEAAYKKIRNVLTLTVMYKYLDTEQCDRFPASICNLDSLQKYVYPATEGVTVMTDGTASTVKYSFLSLLQGDRKAHGHWWLNHRLELYDAKYMGGSYTSPALEFKAQWTAETAESTDGTSHVLSLTSAREFYYALKGDAAVERAEIAAGGTHDFTQTGDIAIGTAFYLYGGAWAKKIDLSQWAGMDTLNFNGTFPVLEELVMGRTDSNLTTLSVGTSLPRLRKFTMAKASATKNIDFGGCTLLEEADLSGCTDMTEAAFPDGAPLATLHLPASYTTLTLKGMPNITADGITFDAITALKRLRIENCTLINGFDLIGEVLSTSGNSLAYLRVTGIDASGDGTILKTIYNSKIGGITADSLPVSGSCSLQGTYQLTIYMEDSLCDEIRAYMPELDIKEPEYTMIEFDDSVSDDANVSNLDNGTGYKYGSSYVPSGHISNLLGMRHRVLAKVTKLATQRNVTMAGVDTVTNNGDGEMTYCQLDDGNSNVYADGTAAKLDSTEGDWMMLEPHRWTKGINDYLNKKRYSCFSSRVEMPSVPDAKVLKYADIPTANIKRYYKITTGKATLESAYTADTSYAVCKVDVSGYKRVRFPTVLGTNQTGSIFTDDAGTVKSSVLADALNQDFEAGMYIISDIPDGATLLHFTILITGEFDKVVLSNSDKIEDMEPDWVEESEYMCGVVGSTTVNSKLRSCISGGSTTGSMTWGDFHLYSAKRGMQQIDVTMHNWIANLFFAKYGRRDSQGQCGSGSASEQRITGGTASRGMTDTTSTENTVNTCCLGYEDIYGHKYDMMDNVDLPNDSGNTYKWRIWMPDGTQRYVKGTSVNGGWTVAVAHGKYMDMVPVCVQSGSSSTYYCDYYNVNSGVSRVVYRGYNNANTNGGVSYANANYGASSSFSVVGSRLAFRGKIVKAESVNAYKAITEIA